MVSKTFYISFLLIAVNTFISAQSVIKWYSIEEAIVLNKETPRKIVLDIYTDWCGWCKKMDNTTFKDPILSTYLNDNFYPVKFNAEYKADILFNGKTYRYIKKGKRGYHELASFLLHGKLSYPSFVFLEESLEVIQPISSYIEAQKFLMISTYFSENKHKTIPWTKFAKQDRKEHGIQKKQ